METIEKIRETAFPFVDDLVHTFIGGSELHGAKVQGTDDMDIYGLYVEPPWYVIGLDKFEHFVWSTSGQHERNGPEDVDITLYGLRKWAGMAAKGNPTALHFLFSDSPTRSNWRWLRMDLKEAVLAKSSARQFKGFVDAQMGRLLGTRGQGKHGQRPELINNFGYDVKAGMHAVRLLNECIELMNTGHITLPRPEKDLLITIRTGQWSLDKLSSYVNQLFNEVRLAEASSKLPDHPDKVKLSQIVVKAYGDHWRKRGFVV